MLISREGKELFNVKDWAGTRLDMCTLVVSKFSLKTNVLAAREVKGRLLPQLLEGRMCLMWIMAVYERDQ